MQIFRNWLIVVAILFLAVVHVHAQTDGKATQQRQLVTFIDIEKALGEHVGLQEKLEALEKEQADFKNKVAIQRQTIKSLVEELAHYRPGAPDYVELEEHISKIKAKLESRIEMQNRQSARAKAAANYNAYMQIVRLIYKFAESNNIGAVINFDSSAIDSDDPDSVTKALKRTVVFQRNLDITSLITQSYNQAQSADSEDGPKLR